VEIVTNGSLIPDDIKEARLFFSQFPSNVIWTLSVESDHEEQMARVQNGRSLKKLVRITEALHAEETIDVEYWVNSNLLEVEDSKVVLDFGIEDAFQEGRVKEEGSAIFQLREVQGSDRMVEPFIIRVILEEVPYESPGNGLFYFDESWDSETSWSPMMMGPPSLQR
jgi:hypothetical protein